MGKAAEEASLAGTHAKEAQDGAAQLERQFERAKVSESLATNHPLHDQLDHQDALDRKAKDSGANKQRAERLRERAKALAEAANMKFKVSCVCIESIGHTAYIQPVLRVAALVAVEFISNPVVSQFLEWLFFRC